MKNKVWVKSCLFWVSLANILFAAANIIILVHLAPADGPKELDFDYYGVIVGVISVLVTLLLGWNIYSVIDIKTVRKEFDLMSKENKRSLLESKNQFDTLEQNLNKTSLDNIMSTIDILTGSGFVEDDCKEAAKLRVYCRLLVVQHRLKDTPGYSETLDGIYDYYKTNKDSLSLPKDEASSILAILFPIVKSEAKYSKFSEIYNWLSSFLMK